MTTARNLGVGMLTQKLQNKLINLARTNIFLPDSNKLHFTFIMERNKVISFGWNRSWRTHTIAKRYNYRHECQHSELVAILNFRPPIRELPYHYMVNIRLHKNGNIAMSKPCASCQAMLSDFGISDIFYSTNEGFKELR